MAEGTEQPASAAIADAPVTKDNQGSTQNSAEQLPSTEMTDTTESASPTEGVESIPAEDEEEEPLGEYVEVKPSAIFMTGATQAIFACEADKDVTPENPQKLVTLEAVKADMKQRAAVSDFSVYKKEWNEYQGEEVLVVLDPDFVYGENYFTFTTQDDMNQWLMNQRIAAAEAKKAKKKKSRSGDGTAEDDDDSEDETSEDEETTEIKPQRPEHWTSLGSEIEVNEGIWAPQRPKITIQLSRRRRLFGAPVSFSHTISATQEVEEGSEIGDKKKKTDTNGENADEDDETTVDHLNAEWKTVVPDEKKDADGEIVIEQPLHRRLRQTASQAVPEVASTSSQTNWLLKRNKITQYEPRTTPVSVSNTVAPATPTSGPLTTPSTRRNSRAGVAERGNGTTVCHEAQTEPKEDTKLHAFVSRVAPAMFTALEENTVLELFREDYELLKTDTTEPVPVGTTANIVKEYQSYRYGGDRPFYATSMDWHPIHDGVFALASARRQNFDERLVSSMAAVSTVVSVWHLRNPIQPVLLLHAPDDVFSVAFCPTDATLIVGGCVNGQVVVWDLATHAHVLQAGQHDFGVGSGGNGTDGKSAPLVYPTALSSIEHSHQSSISQVRWLPLHVELARNGTVQPWSRSQQCQQFLSVAADANVLVWDLRSAVPEKETYQRRHLKLLDLSWRPLLKIFVGAVENTDNGTRTFSFRDAPSDGSPDTEPDPLQTKLFVGTERGSLLYLDWRAPESDGGKLGVQKVDFGIAAHGGPIANLSRSRFDPSLVLSAGGISVCLWREGVRDGALLHASTDGIRTTGVEWSPTRPAVFFVSKADGTVDVWDLLDTTYTPTLTSNVCAPLGICHLRMRITSGDGIPLFAAGDDDGVLHVMEMPRGYTVPMPNELDRLHAWVDSEIVRLGYVDQRMVARATTDAHRGQTGGQTSSRLGGAADGEPVSGDGDDPAVGETLSVDDLFEQFQAQEKDFLVAVGLAEPETADVTDDA
eukprot:m.862508 g.862508  ORF g.862508 m.862508 type:complete len:987 (-) comp23535_c0_seq1:54-3014(-)